MQKLRFLVADDSEMVLDMIESAFKDMGAVRVDRVVNGKDAVLKLKRSVQEGIPYALVTLDWEMPEMTGVEVLRFIRGEKELMQIKVIMITSNANPENILEIKPLRPNGYLVKPFTQDQLKEKIKSVLQISAP